MKTRVLFILVSAVLFISFYGFSAVVKNGFFNQINFDFTVRLQDNIPSKMDEIFEDAGFLVSPTVSIFLCLFITILYFSGNRFKKIYPGALLIPLLFSLMIGAEMYGKSKVESPAPPFFMIKNPITIFPKYHVQEEYSYPSGHASRSLFFAVLFSYYFLRIKKKLFFLFVTGISIVSVTTISIGKVYLGHHWLTDIIGGWIISLAFISLCIPLLQAGMDRTYFFRIKTL